MYHEESIDRILPDPYAQPLDEQSRSSRRFATGVYIVYALVILIQVLFVLLPGLRATNPMYGGPIEALLLLLFPCLFVVLMLVFAFVIKDRAIIAFFALVHFILGLLIFFIMACVFCDLGAPWAGDQNLNLMTLVMFGNLHVIIPLAVLVTYFKENKAPIPEEIEGYNDA